MGPPVGFTLKLVPLSALMAWIERAQKPKEGGNPKIFPSAQLSIVSKMA